MPEGVNEDYGLVATIAKHLGDISGSNNCTSDTAEVLSYERREGGREGGREERGRWKG